MFVSKSKFSCATLELLIHFEHHLELCDVFLLVGTELFEHSLQVERSESKESSQGGSLERWQGPYWWNSLHLAGAERDPWKDAGIGL